MPKQQNIKKYRFELNHGIFMNMIFHQLPIPCALCLSHRDPSYPIFNNPFPGKQILYAENLLSNNKHCMTLHNGRGCLIFFNDHDRVGGHLTARLWLVS